MMPITEFLELGKLAKRATLLLGQPGIRKSAEVKQFAEREAIASKRMFVEWDCISFEEKRQLLTDKEYLKTVYLYADTRLSGNDPTDMKGLPMFFETGDGSYVEWRPPMVFAVLSQPDCMGCLFLDEITQCPLAIQAPAYQLILDKCIGEIKLSDSVFMTAAGNRPEDKTGAFALGTALRNRFSHMTVEPPTIQQWTVDFALLNNIHSDIIAYLNFRPDHLTAKMADVHKSGDNAYPTPRTWEFASDFLHAYENLHKQKPDFDTIIDIVGANVGHAHAVEYEAFVRLLRDVKMKDIIANPSILKTYMNDKDGLSKVWAVIGAVPDYYAQHEKAQTREDLLDVCSHLEVDYAVAMLRMLIQRFPTLNREFLSCPNKAVVIKYAKYL